MLMPKKVKYRKQQRGRMTGKAWRGSDISFGEFGLKALSCGWITDRFGVRWQITPTVLGKLLADPDKAKARRAAEEMMKQVKFDIAKLQAAADGR